MKRITFETVFKKVIGNLNSQEVRFNSAWARKKRLDYMEMPCYVVSSADLIKMKNFLLAPKI